MQSIFPEFKFHRGSTPVLAFSLPLALNAAKDKLIITFSQDYEVRLEKTAGETGCSVEGKQATVQLTQAETMALLVGDCEVQLRYLLADGTADVSNPILGQVLRTAKEGVIA